MDAPRDSKTCFSGVRNDLAIIVLSAALGFCLWFGGGWLLVGPARSPDADADAAVVLAVPAVAGLCWATGKHRAIQARAAHHD